MFKKGVTPKRGDEDKHHKKLLPPAIIRCSSCGLADDCIYKTDDDMPCEYRIRRWNELDDMFKRDPKRYIISNIKEKINAVAVELERETELDKKRELTKIFIDANTRLNNIIYGTKTVQEVMKAEVDVNELVRQAMEAEKKVALVDADGATIATVEKEKKDEV